MTTEQRFERTLPALLEDLYLGPTPDYRDTVLATATRTRQRPAWTFPGRWLPMADITRRTAFVPRIPMRALAVALVIMALVVATATVYVGSQRRLPPPFGLAANGLVAYADGGTIFTVDPGSRAVTTIATREGTAIDPYFSPDGTRLVYQRSVPFEGLFVYSATLDGSGERRLTPDPSGAIFGYDFASDGRSIVINRIVDAYQVGPGVLSVVKSDGSDFRTLDLDVSAEGAAYRPGGADILFGGTSASAPPAILLVADDGTNLRTLVQLQPGAGVLGVPQWSPDGTRIAYTLFEREGAPLRVHVMTVDAAGRATGDAIVAHDEAATSEGWPLWSPDGNRLLIERWAPDGTVRPVIATLDASAPDVEIDYLVPPQGVMKSWSPDGAFILVTPEDEQGGTRQQLLWDTRTGASTTAPWSAKSAPSWQRTAR